jgi:hypothetical protein
MYLAASIARQALLEIVIHNIHFIIGDVAVGSIPYSVRFLHVSHHSIFSRHHCQQSAFSDLAMIKTNLFRRENVHVWLTILSVFDCGPSYSGFLFSHRKHNRNHELLWRNISPAIQI